MELDKCTILAEMFTTRKVREVARDPFLFIENGELKQSKVLELSISDNKIGMFNVEFVEKNHTFFANGILVHNKFISK